MSRTITGLVVVSATISTIALGVILLLGYQVVLAPPPQQFQELPVRLASNPGDAENWNFKDPHPILHQGDQLVADFHVCYTDVFGGSNVDVQSRRSIVSADGTTRAALRTVSLTFLVGCHTTRSILDTIPQSIPDGTYRVVGMTVAVANYYSRRVEWTSVPFDVVSLPDTGG